MKDVFYTSAQHDASKDKQTNVNNAIDNINNNNNKDGVNNAQQLDRSASDQKPAESRTQSTSSAYINREPNTQRFNFASAECGAKVLRSNLEAKVGLPAFNFIFKH